MKAFMDSEFLLSTETAQELFHTYAEKTPILDYHCHINPQEIAEDRQFENCLSSAISCGLIWQ